MKRLSFILILAIIILSSNVVYAIEVVNENNPDTLLNAFLSGGNC